MRIHSAWKSVIFAAALCWCAPGQDTPGKDAPGSDARGLPPRGGPADYGAKMKVGDVTIAGEFDGHAVPTEIGSPLTTEEYVCVEVAFFGPPQAKLRLQPSDFSLRINGKKNPQPYEPYELVFKSLKDPDWEPPEAAKPKSKTSLGGGGDSPDGNLPPVPVHPPISVVRSMQQRVQKAALPEGDRALPQAGLIFFQHRGKRDKIESLELIYEGPAGKASMPLRP